jgi:hypothetical protein
MINARKLCLRFEFSGEEHAPLARQLELMWDGMRRLPFTDVQIATALTNRILLATGTSKRRVIGETTLIEFGDDDSYTFADCAVESLRAAFRPDLQALVTEEEWRRIEGSPVEALRLLVDPKQLFCFESFVQLFAEQIIPTQARFTWGDAGKHYSLSFSPTRVLRFGLH